MNNECVSAMWIACTTLASQCSTFDAQIVWKLHEAFRLAAFIPHMSTWTTKNIQNKVYGCVFKCFLLLSCRKSLCRRSEGKKQQQKQKQQQQMTKNYGGKNDQKKMKGNTTEKHGVKSLQVFYVQRKWNPTWCSAKVVLARQPSTKCVFVLFFSKSNRTV